MYMYFYEQCTNKDWWTVIILLPHLHVISFWLFYTQEWCFFINWSVFIEYKTYIILNKTLSGTTSMNCFRILVLNVHVYQFKKIFSPRSKKFPYGHGDNAKLLRLIEQSLLEAGEELDFHRINIMFQQADRQHRGMLSADQVIQLLGPGSSL